MENVGVSCLRLLLLENFNTIVTYESVAYKKHGIKIVPVERKNNSLTEKEYEKQVLHIVFYPEILSLCIISIRLGGKKIIPPIARRWMY